MREDDQVKAALHLKKAAIIHPGWTIEGDNEQQNEFVEAVFDGMEGTVEGVIRSILSAYDYGFSLHEKVYRYIEAGPFSGKIGIEALRQKSPTRIDFNVDPFGKLKPMGIIQVQQTGTRKPLDPAKFILHVYQQEFDNYYGESDLKAAYRFWFLKVNFFRYWGMYLEKFGIPLVWGKVTTPTVDATDQAKFRTIVANLQAGMAAVAPDNLDLNFLEPSQSGKETFAVAIDVLNVSIARSILMPQLVGLAPQGNTGSLARAQEESDTLDMVLGGDSREVEDTLNEQLIRPLIDMNFGKMEVYPQFKFKPMREEDKNAFVEAWADAVSKGAATSTPETEEHTRGLLGFPEATEAEKKKMQEPKETPGTQLPAKGNGKGKGNGVDQKVYVLTTLNAQEARKAWKEHVEQLDGLEDGTKRELSDAFSDSILSLAVDAKKNS
jgi:phage gp29-like protein